MPTRAKTTMYLPECASRAVYRWNRLFASLGVRGFFPICRLASGGRQPPVRLQQGADAPRSPGAESHFDVDNLANHQRAENLRDDGGNAHLLAQIRRPQRLDVIRSGVEHEAKQRE